MEAKAYRRDQREWRLTGRSKARPEEVYDVLSDLRTHLEWAGKRQFKGFRLLSMDAPAGPAMVGTEFTSTGTIPMHRTRFENRNTVTEADRARVFEINTESTIPWRRRAPGQGSFINRYEISPDGDGSRVTYRSKQLLFRNPAWGLRYPLLREITYRVWVPIWSGRGFRNMLRMADERASQTAAA